MLNCSVQVHFKDGRKEYVSYTRWCGKDLESWACEKIPVPWSFDVAYRIAGALRCKDILRVRVFNLLDEHRASHA